MNHINPYKHTLITGKMTKWTFEPGHTAAEFAVKHMMVTWVRGHLKPVEGKLEFDPEDPSKFSVEVTIDAKQIWTGDKARDDHLKSKDFLDVENHPSITFKGDKVKLIGENEFKVTGDLTIRGITKEVTFDFRYLGQWQTPFWEDGKDKGPKTRAGFVATTTINRHDFDVSWNDNLDKGGIIVGDDVHITIDAEAIETS